MTLIVEDGTGLANADSYVSLVTYDAYLTARGLTGGTEGENEIDLRLATEFVDTFRRYKGTRTASAQNRQFPRTGLTDWDGHTVTGIPNRVMDATCYLASQARANGALYEDLDRGGRIRSESVGPISTTYMDDAPAGKVYTVVEKLLAPYVRDTKDTRPTPFFSPANTTDENTARAAYFTVGMHDD